MWGESDGWGIFEPYAPSEAAALVAPPAVRPEQGSRATTVVSTARLNMAAAGQGKQWGWKSRRERRRGMRNYPTIRTKNTTMVPSKERSSAPCPPTLHGLCYLQRLALDTKPTMRRRLGAARRRRTRAWRRSTRRIVASAAFGGGVVLGGLLEVDATVRKMSSRRRRPCRGGRAQVGAARRRR